MPAPVAGDDDATGGARAALPEPLVLYDGTCGLCHKSVRFILRRDHAGRASFAPLQGPTADRVRAAFPGALPDGLDSVVVVDAGRVFLRSRAFARIALLFRGPWRALSWARFVPRFLADAVYWVVAKTRYRLFGRRDACDLPAPDERARFLP